MQKITLIQIRSTSYNNLYDTDKERAYILNLEKFDTETNKNYSVEKFLSEAEVLSFASKYLKIESEEEQKEKAIKEFMKEKEDDKETIKKYPALAPKYEVGMKCEAGKIYNRFGELIQCLISHTADYEHLPENDSEYWSKDLDKVVTKEVTHEELNENPEYIANYKTAKGWNRGDTYEADSYITWYRKLYKSTERLTKEEEPGVSDKWKEIPKTIQTL